MRIFWTLLSSLIVITSIHAQLPPEAKITVDGKMVYGSDPVDGFYQRDVVHKIEFLLEEPDWFIRMDGPGGRGGSEGEVLIGKVILNDTLTLDSVELSIKGNTSDTRNRSEKKSFSVKTDPYLDQDIMGYDNLNLNCAYEDEAGMREVLYYDICRPFTPSLKGSIIDLYINGQYWGPYNNVQQIEGRYVSEWFTDNDGTRWRALAPDGVTLPGGPFGTGLSSLNYHGDDSTQYNDYYTIKKTEVDDPWAPLIRACDDINNLPFDGIYEALKYSLDIDKMIWLLVQEVIFSDDDSYIHKGGMDYYVYWDVTTDRILPMEVDGNSVMGTRNGEWSVFYNETDARYPLMNRLLQVPEIRQRYLAHMRSVLRNYLSVEDIHGRIDHFANLLDERVQNDPKAIYTYAQFINEVDVLKQWHSDRIDFLLSNDEVDRVGLEISDVTAQSVNDGLPAPAPLEEMTVTVAVAGDAQMVRLYYSEGVEGVFERVTMLDDGMNDDGGAGDGVYGARIPGFNANSLVRYYFESIANDGFETANFLPYGAEHDMFVYQVGQAPTVAGAVVINEFMASNQTTVQDGEGEFEDWIELYNVGDSTVDLTGYTLTDDATNITKWTLPDGTSLDADEYLIIWADDDEEDTTPEELHCSFKLSAGGESILLVNSAEEIVDQIDFEEQDGDVSFARKPNGNGDFEKGEHTFDQNNDELTSIEDYGLNGYTVFPNPTTAGIVTLSIDSGGAYEVDLKVVNTLGAVVPTTYTAVDEFTIQIKGIDWPRGSYVVQLHDVLNGEIKSLPLIVQ